MLSLVYHRVSVMLFYALESVFIASNGETWKHGNNDIIYRSASDNVIICRSGNIAHYFHVV